MANEKKQLEIIARLKDGISQKLTFIRRSFAKMAIFARNALRGLSRAVFNLRTGLIGLITALAARSFVRAAADIEKYRVQLTAIYGDAKQAQKTLRDIRDFAAESPLQTKDVIEGFKRLEAVGVESAETVIKKLGNVALIFDREVAEVANAFIGLNKRTLRELGVEVDRQGQYITIAAGKGAKRMVVEIEKANKTTIQLNKEIRQSLLDIWAKQFPDAMELAGSTFDSKMAVFKSRIFELMADIGERYLPKIKEWITSLTDFLTSHHNEIVAFFTALPDIWDAVIERLQAKLESTKTKIKTGFWDWLKRPLTMWGEMKGFEGKTLNDRIDDIIDRLERNKKGGWKVSYHVHSKEEIPLLEIIQGIIERQAKALETKNKELKESVNLVKQENKALDTTLKKVEELKSPLAQFIDSFRTTLSGSVTEEGRKIDGLIDKFRDLEEHGKLAAHNLAYGVKESFSSLFKDIIRQTKSVEEVFIDFGNRILDVFANIAAEFAAQQLTAAIFKGLGVFTGFGFANGGVMPGTFRAFAAGGISNGPTLGLIGEGKYKREAVVPLPDGKSIPVDLKGSAQNSINNVIVINALDGQSVMRIMPQVEAFLINSIYKRGRLREAIQDNV